MAITKRLAEDINLGRGGSYSDSRDGIKHQVWDTRNFAATVTDYTFFNQPIGASWNGGSKTLNETNLNNTSQFPNGQTFLAKKMWVKAISNFDTTEATASLFVQDYITVLQNSVFELVIAGREFDFQCHGSQFLPSISISGNNAVTVNQASYGNLMASGCVSFGDAPIFIDQLVTFSVKHRLGSGIAAVNTIANVSTARLNGAESYLQVVLEGTLTRAK